MFVTFYLPSYKLPTTPTALIKKDTEKVHCKFCSNKYVLLKNYKGTESYEKQYIFTFKLFHVPLF